MEGLLHPVGPEDARTYWIRRAAAVLVVVVLVVGLGFMIANIGRADAPVVAEPTGPAPQAPAPAAPAPEAPAPMDRVIEEEAVPVPSSAETSRRAPARAEEPADESGQQQAPAAPNPSTGPTRPAIPNTSAAPPVSEDPLPPEPENTFHRPASLMEQVSGQTPAMCDDKAVKVSIDGPTQVRKDNPVMYAIGITNTSDKDCAILVNDKTFELKVHSGQDRIWSSHDCVAGMPPRGAVLAAGRSLEWQMEWRADRSMAQCKTDPEPMGSGTYVVTAQLANAGPAQLVLQFEA
ncbi:hypothetical protein [Granulicoccus sp. GXG6511]|uniref:hypothetical protein n=1 Tax=Granulicoccus sp. GXG6511 TaxID=3381351 RepID=UPI003D7D4359